MTGYQVQMLVAAFSLSLFVAIVAMIFRQARPAKTLETVPSAKVLTVSVFFATPDGTGWLTTGYGHTMPQGINDAYGNIRSTAMGSRKHGPWKVVEFREGF